MNALYEELPVMSSHEEAFTRHIDAKGLRILDVGCGNGHFARTMTKLGGHVIGIDPGEKQLSRARAEDVVGDETYMEGVAEDLPAENGSIDAVVFFNSLHHVPVDQMTKAMEEARRVLKPGGVCFICEPIAAGPMFEVNKIFNDETEVRAKAYESLKAAAGQGFEEVEETEYATVRVYPAYEDYRENSTSVNPKRATLFDELDAELRERFERFGKKQADGYHFQRPNRVNVLRAV